MYASVFTTDLDKREILYEIAEDFSPAIEESTSQSVVFDIGGTFSLMGAPRDVAKAIFLTAIKSGLSANVAISQNADAALCAARFLNGITVISPGKERKSLSDISIVALHNYSNIRQAGKNSLKLEQEQITETVETLKRWGILRFGGFTDLSEKQVYERLGWIGLQLYKYASGVIDRPLTIKNPIVPFLRTMELEHSIDLLEPLSFIFSRLINELCDYVKSLAMSVQEIFICMKLDDKSECECAFRVPFPTSDEKTLLSLAMLTIKSQPPQLPIISVAISANPVRSRFAQAGLFEKGAAEPEKLELMLARLEKLVGADNAGWPSLLNTNRPDAFIVNRFEALRTSRSRWPQESSKEGYTQDYLIGLRLFRPPIKASVKEKSGAPHSIRAKDNVTNSAIRGNVTQMHGPCRITGEWWDADEWLRDEWDIALSDGNVYKIYRDLKNASWFIEGVYD
jgi:protein ImuB